MFDQHKSRDRSLRGVVVKLNSPCKPGVVGLILRFSCLSDETSNYGPMIIFQDKLLTRTNCDEAGDYAVPNVLRLSPRNLIFRPDIEHKTGPSSFEPHHEKTCLLVSDQVRHKPLFVLSMY